MNQMKKSGVVFSALTLVAILLTACGKEKAKFIAPEISPPADLIPSYVPEGFKLVSGFTLDGEIHIEEFDVEEDSNRFSLNSMGDLFFNEKSPAGTAINGVYYDNGEELILITKASYPGGNLDLWKQELDKSRPGNCECDCGGLIRLDVSHLTPRFNEILPERAVGDTRVAVLQSYFGYVTVFMRGEDLLIVESGISLEENLKIVASLLGE
ncbi:MAG: hypothetical protein HGA28_00620 [Anaerolineaceae bacterium]|nr:hypothetical protein [Anaerolineaceae bacterium]